MAAKKRTKVKKKKKKAPPNARVYIKATFNNTTITLTDTSGNVLAWNTCGKAEFKGSKKGTPFAAQMSAENLAKEALDMGVKQIEIFVKGPGSGRESAIRALQAAGLDIASIKDVTPLPHNGCRPRKRRRV